MWRVFGKCAEFCRDLARGEPESSRKTGRPAPLGPGPKVIGHRGRRPREAQAPGEVREPVHRPAALNKNIRYNHRPSPPGQPECNERI